MWTLQSALAQDRERSSLYGIKTYPKPKWMATLEAQEAYSRRREPECVKDDQACSGELLSALRVLRLLR
jgi:hypothetical protein